MSDGKKIDEFENERRELIGLRKLMGIIENDIKVLNDYEEQERAKSARK